MAYCLTTSNAPSQRCRAQGLNDFVAFGTPATSRATVAP